MDLSLPELDLPEDPERLRAAALAELEAAGGTSFRAPAYVEEGEPTGTVLVAVDRANAVIDVHFRWGWQQAVTTAQLGDALLEARQNASLAMINALALEELARREGGQAEPVEPPPPPPVPGPSPSPDEIWRRLTDAEDRVYRATRAARAAREARTLRTFSGLLTATCEGSTITRITVDPVLAHRAGTEQLRSAAMELFQLTAEASERDDR